MKYKYGGTWAHLNRPIMDMHAQGLDAREIYSRILQGYNTAGRYGDTIQIGMVNFIIQRNTGTWVKPKKPPHWEIWTAERQFKEFEAERNKFGLV